MSSGAPRWFPRGRPRRVTGDSPFGVLGLAARPGLTDDEVRSAWRRVAAACHPDRPDGGDPARFAAAAAAYTVLRTASGRGEALADLHAASSRRAPTRPGPGRLNWPGAAGRLAARIRRGRPARLALRTSGAAAVIALTVLAGGTEPAALALITGALTWLALTARHDLAPPGS
jgi:curved DNA-binding protein CbpA